MAARRRDVAAGATLLLAIESSGRRPSAAVLRGEELLAEVSGEAGRSGAESLLPCVDAALEQAGLGLEAIGALAVSIGPGSFTGLRVGVATAKGLAFGSERRLVAVPTLAALALPAASHDVPVVALLDARRGELYAAAWQFERDGGPGVAALALEPHEGVYTPEALAPRLPRPCVLTGEGAQLCAERLSELAGRALEVAATADPRARDVGWLAQRSLAAGETLSEPELLPRYLRRAQAEVKRTGERFE